MTLSFKPYGSQFPYSSNRGGWQGLYCLPFRAIMRLNYNTERFFFFYNIIQMLGITVDPLVQQNYKGICQI